MSIERCIPTEIGFDRRFRRTRLLTEGLIKLNIVAEPDWDKTPFPSAFLRLETTRF